MPGALVEEVARGFGGVVDNVFEPARVLRTPGTVNRKDVPVPVTVEFPGGPPVSLSALDEACPAVAARPAVAPSQPAPEAGAPLVAARAEVREQDAPYHLAAWQHALRELDECRRTARPDWTSGDPGPAWDATCWRSARVGVEVANTVGPGVLSLDQARAQYLAHAPRDGAFDPEDKWRRAEREVGDKVRQPPVDLSATVAEWAAELGQPVPGVSVDLDGRLGVLQAHRTDLGQRDQAGERCRTVEDVTGASVRIVDDTWTTGAHVQSGSAAAKQGDAERVAAVALGRWFTDDYRDHGAWRRARRAPWSWESCCAHVEGSS